MQIITPEHQHITVLVSVYKPVYFEDFLEDLYAQTYFDSCRVEIFEVGVSDPSCKLKMPDNVRYRTSEKVDSVYQVWNRLAQESKTDYLCNYNIDDRSDKKHLEVLSNCLDLHDDISLAYCPCFETQVPNETMSNNSSGGKGFPCHAFDSKTYWRNNSAHSRPMWRKSLHSNYGYFDPIYKVVADYDMWLRSISRGAKFMKATEEPLYLYYRNPAGVSSSTDGVKQGVEEIKQIRGKFAF